MAATRDTSLPELVISALEHLEKSFEATPKPNLAKEIEDLKAEVSRLTKELRLQENLIEKYESELYRTRHAAFAEVSPTDVSRSFDMDLIQALKTGRKAMDSGAILAALGIDPGDREAVRLVRNQLEALSRYGLVSESSHGWSWKK